MSDIKSGYVFTGSNAEWVNNQETSLRLNKMIDSAVVNILGGNNVTIDRTAAGIVINSTGGGGSTNTILNGTTAPASTVGNVGDFYINTTNETIYGPKNTSGSPWGSPTSLIGPTGATGTAGSVWYTGTGSPSISGAVNDLYLDTATESVYKCSGGTTWAYLTNIKGATGSSGTNGATWYTGTGSPTISGAANDLYLDTATENVWKCVSGTNWGSTYITNIKGTAGTNGTNGTNGINGATWYTGTGSPSGVVTGVTNDLYLDTSTSNVWKCVSGTNWGSTFITNIKGATGSAGAPGSVWYNGSGVPSSGLGVNGDYYLNNSNGDVYNKASGSWTYIENIKGPAGSGTGDVTGPSGATANNVAIFNGVTGKIIKDGGTLATSAFTDTTNANNISSGLLSPTYGGTGVNNGTKKITLGGNLTTSGSFDTTLTTTAATSVTLPVSGTLLSSSTSAGGDLTGTYPSPTLATISGLPSSSVGDSTHVPQITVDSKGRVTALTSTAISSGGLPSFTSKYSRLGINSSNTAAQWFAPDVFNVKDYGAKGDGVNDDTSSINAAVAAVCANVNTKDGSAQGCVYFPAGTYLISGAQGSGSGVQADGGIHLPLGLSSTLMIQITFKGDGPKNSVIMQTDTGDGIHIDFSNQISPNGDGANAGYLSTCNIFDLGLMACNTSGSSGTASNVAIFIKNNTIDVPEYQTGNHIRDVAIWNPVNGNYSYGLKTVNYNNTGWTHGIILGNNAHAFLSNISLHGNSNAGNRSAGWATSGAGSGYGIWIYGGKNLTLDGILASYWGKALYVNSISGLAGPQGILVTRFNSIANNYGIHVEGNPLQGWSGITSIFIENFQVDNGNQIGNSPPYFPYAYGILIENAVDVRIATGNIEFNTTHNTNAAVELRGCYTSTITNCWVGQTGSGGSGPSVLLSGNSSSEYTSGCIVSNNVFIGWVQINANCDNNYIGPNSYNGKVGIYSVPAGLYHPHQRIPQVTDNGSNTINIDQYVYNINPVYN